MKVAIIGTRGIPNHYGGFEQFAEYLSKYLADNHHEVYVYNSHNHPYQLAIWNNVNIIHKYDPEIISGTIGQFIYDLNCILDSRDRNYDIILQLGYTSSSIWSPFFPKDTCIVTNMDGLEWKRSKYKWIVQKYLHLAEAWAVKRSDHLISDSIGIQKYLYSRYKKTSHYIAYGAHVFYDPDFTQINYLNITAKEYDLIIARLEPENNIETILDGVVEANVKRKILIVGGFKTLFAKYLMDKFKNHTQIVFLGAIYDIKILNNLRYFSKLYFHGHSVGGTNPSLLEAMASSALICAHKNIFNVSVLGNDAYYFEDFADVSQLIATIDKNEFVQSKIANNLYKIEHEFSWPVICKKYETFLLECLN